MDEKLLRKVPALSSIFFIEFQTVEQKQSGVEGYINKLINLPADTEFLTDYKRRQLMFPFLPFWNKQGFGIKFVSTFLLLKVFVPKNIKFIYFRNFNNKRITGGLWDYTDVTLDTRTLYEGTLDKVISIYESVNQAEGASDIDFEVQVHTYAPLNPHLEDIESVPGQSQALSILNKSMLRDMFLPSSGELAKGTYLGTDMSALVLGSDIREDIHLYKYNTGIVSESVILGNDLSVLYLGDSGSSFKFVASDLEVPRYGIARWGISRFRPENI